MPKAPHTFTPAQPVPDEVWRELELLYIHIPVGLAVLDADLRYLRVNPRLARLNGLSPDEHVGRLVDEVLPNQGAELRAVLLDVLRSGRPIIDRELRGGVPGDPRDDRIWHESVFPIGRRAGGAGALLVIARDVTDEVRAREELLERQAQMELAFEIARAAPFRMDVATRSGLALVGFRDVNGMPPGPQEITYDEWLAHVHPDDRERVDTYLAGVFASRGAAHAIEYRVNHPTLGLRWIDARGRHVYDDDGKPRTVAGVHVDITEQKEREIALREATQRMERAIEESRAKSRMLAIASHDVRQPLHAMGLFLSALDRRVDTPETRKLVASLKAAASSMQGMFDALLDMTKIDAGLIEAEPQVVPLGPIVVQAIEEFRMSAERKGLTLTADTVPFSGITDPTLLSLVLRNLLGNAVRYTASGAIHITAATVGGRVRLSVRDTGPGIPPDQQDAVFQEFVRLGPKGKVDADGLGLGLAIVRRIALLNDTPVSLESTVGVGSVFHVDIPSGPATAEPAQAQAAGAPGPSVELAGLDVLVIDDQPQARSAMAQHLADIGCTVRTGANADEALELAFQRKPDLIVVDLDLGGGADGVAVIAAIDKMTAPTRLPAVIVTGSTDAAARARIAQCRAAHLVKPIDPIRLTRLIAAGALRPTTIYRGGSS